MGHFFPDSFPSFWDKFEEMVQAGAVVSVREVRNELERQAIHDHILEWAKAHNEFFPVPSAEETEFVRDIFGNVAKFREMVRKKNILEGWPVADPFLVASGKINERCVVTEEKERRNSAQLPNVCAHYQVKCTDLEGFMNAERMRY